MIVIKIEVIFGFRGDKAKLWRIGKKSVTKIINDLNPTTPS